MSCAWIRRLPSCHAGAKPSIQFFEPHSAGLVEVHQQRKRGEIMELQPVVIDRTITERLRTEPPPRPAALLPRGAFRPPRAGAAISSNARRPPSIRTREHRDSTARETCPTMLMINSSPARRSSGLRTRRLVATEPAYYTEPHIRPTRDCDYLRRPVDPWNILIHQEGKIPMRIQLIVCLTAASAAYSATPAGNAYLQHNLVADLPGNADFTDPNLINAWGIAASATGPFWVDDGGTGLSTVYSSNGTVSTTKVTVPPSAAGTAPSVATGIVFNGTGASPWPPATTRISSSPPRTERCRAGPRP